MWPSTAFASVVILAEFMGIQIDNKSTCECGIMSHASHVASCVAILL